MCKLLSCKVFGAYFLAIFLLSTTAYAQTDFPFQEVTIAPALITSANLGTSEHTSDINTGKIRKALRNAPVAVDVRSSESTSSIDLEVGGVQLSFLAVENTTMSPALKLAAPDVRTYTLESGSIRGRMTTSPDGIHAYLFTQQGVVSIYPDHTTAEMDHVIEYGVVDHGHVHTVMCGHVDEPDDAILPKMTNELKAAVADVSNGGTLREYRLALVATGEFWQANGNSVTPVTAAITSTVDAMNEIFMRDVSFRFTLLTPRLFNNPDTDPFTPDDAGGAGRTEQAGIAVGNSFNINTYDVGHVFHTHASGDGWSGGGVAQLRSVCGDFVSGNGSVTKARGWSGSFDNTTIGWIQLASHEFGHMFNCPHTFNGSGSSCDDAISQSTAYEIASGTTIMSYNGICSAGQNIPQSGDLDSYFHSNSLLRMIDFINDIGNCPPQSMVDNTPPEIDADPCGLAGNFTIPRETPFILRGEGSDAEGDIIDYIWEQYDEDGSQSTATQGFIGLQAGTSDRAPLFRSFPPSPRGNERYFPSRDLVMDGIFDQFEVLPRRERMLHFQLVARDNNPLGGGVALQEIEVPVSANGPLLVTSPTAASSFTTGDNTNVTWSTGGSGDLCAQVDVLLSIDGGQSFAYVLAQGVNYDAGSAAVTIPGSAVNTTRAKVMIQCSDNTCIQFYNVSDGEFTIDSDCVAESVRACPTDAVSFNQGDPGLDLGLSVLQGNPTSMTSVTITDADEGFLFPALSDAGDCFVGFSARLKTFRFATESAGSYRFPLDNWQRVGLSIHVAEDWDRLSPCNSAVASSYLRTSTGTFSIRSSVTAELEACTEYLFVFSTQTDGSTGGFSSFVPSSGRLLALTEPNPDYAYSFIAVDESGIIQFETPTSDFTTAPSGEYEVFAVNYKAGGPEPPTNIDPSTWVGQSIAEVFGGDNCFTISPISKPVEIISTCQITSIDAGLQTTCDPSDNTYEQTVTLTYLLPPSGNIEVLASGVTTTVPVTGSPQEVTLTGLPSDGSAVQIEAYFSENTGCRLVVDDAFVSPENCCPLSLDLPEAINACTDSTVVIDAGSDGAQYTWSIDGTIVAETSSMLAAPVAGVYAVTVVNATGCAKPDETEVTFFNNPSAQLVIDDTLACDGDQILVTLETDGTAVVWTRDGSPTASISDLQVEATQSGLYRADITNVAGCETSIEQAILFNPTPMVELGDNQEVCAGTPITLDAGTAAANFVWFRDGSVIAGQNSSTLDVAQSGMFSVVAEGGGGCDDQDMVTIEIFDLPEITIGGDTAICAGTPVTLFTNPQNVDDFTFTRDGIDLTIPDLSQIVIATGGDYTLTVRNEIGCDVAETLTVVENDLPIVNLDPEKTGCIGSTVLLESPLVGASYSWIFNGSEVSTDATVQVDQQGSYTLLVKDDFGCEGSDDITVIFVPGPSLSIEGDDSFCLGDMSILTATTSGDNIQWSRDGSDIAGATDLTLEVTEAGVYRAAVSGASGCLVEDEISITVFALPTVDAGGGAVLCDGDSEDRTISSTGMGLSYSWTRDGSPVNGDENITLDIAGTYEVVVSDANGCSALDQVIVTTSALPTLAASTTMLDICDGIGEEVSLTTDASMIQWFRDGVAIAGATSGTLSIDTDGQYEAVVSNAAGCTAMIAVSATSRPSPVVDLGADTVLCPGEMITLRSNAGASSTILWSDGSTDTDLSVGNPDLSEQTQETVTVAVTNEFNCENTDDVIVTFRPIIMATIDGPLGVCDGETATLTANGGVNYAWTDPTGTLSATDQASVVASPTETSEYTVVVTDECPGNQDEVSVTLVIFEAADGVSAGEDASVVIGQSIQLAATGGVAYRWAADPTIISGSTQSNPTIAPTEPTTYVVTITDDNGCNYTDSVSVTIVDDPLAAFVAVNIITPNEDGDNDELLFKGLEFYPDNTLRIYNRWGALLFEATGYQTQGPTWNGTRNGELLPADTYYYVLTIDGETIKSALTILHD